MKLHLLLVVLWLGVLISACSTSESLKGNSSEVTQVEEVDSLDALEEGAIQPSYIITTSGRNFTIDKLQQIYLVTDRNEVIKHDPRGREVFRFNNNFLEDIGKLDPSDPFNVLLYYPEYLSVITLDRTMSKTGEFDLSNLNLIRVNALGSTNDNNVWLYDEVSFSLKKINRAGDVLKESVNLNLKLGYSGKPNFLIERSNMVFVNDPDYGILVFSNLGEYDSVIDLKGLNDFQVLGEQIVFQRGNKLFTFHLQSLNEKEIKLPMKIRSGNKIMLQKNRLFVQDSDRVVVYEL